MTGAELKAWREQSGRSPLTASEALGIEPWQLAAYERGQIPIPPYIERLVAELAKED
jgi:predicted transcriptional regulator